MVDVAIWMGFSNLINGVPNHHFLIVFSKKYPRVKTCPGKKHLSLGPRARPHAPEKTYFVLHVRASMRTQGKNSCKAQALADFFKGFTNLTKLVKLDLRFQILPSW